MLEVQTSRMAMIFTDLLFCSARSLLSVSSRHVTQLRKGKSASQQRGTAWQLSSVAGDSAPPATLQLSSQSPLAKNCIFTPKKRIPIFSDDILNNSSFSIQLSAVVGNSNLLFAGENIEFVIGTYDQRQVLLRQVVLNYQSRIGFGRCHLFD